MIIPTDGMIITENTILHPGIYHLPQGITLAANNITLDGNGALLVGSQRQGRGVTVHGQSNVTIQNLRIQEYYHGIYAQRAPHLVVTGCQITATAEVAPNTIFLDIWLQPQAAYGAGILLWDVTDGQVHQNDLQHQMNGLLTYDCQRLQVERNVANYCSGYGFHLYNTSDSRFEANYADFCCRWEPRGERRGHLGADATGFLIVYNSCRNFFRRNFARMSGDGFFLAGLSPKWEKVGCNDNLFEENDGSYSPNIAFEATFSRGNVYRNNYANACNYGFWLGFSREFTLEQNRMSGNRQAGIATENGFAFTVRDNDFEQNAHGILLWSKYVPEFEQCVPENDTSRDWLIEQNRFVRNVKAIRIAADQDHGIRPMPAHTCGIAPRPHHHAIRHNLIRDNRMGIELVDAHDTIVDENQMVDNVEADF